MSEPVDFDKGFRYRVLKCLTRSCRQGRIFLYLSDLFLHDLFLPPLKLLTTNIYYTYQSSLAIEGNTLTEEQIAAILESKRVIARQIDILEV